MFEYILGIYRKGELHLPSSVCPRDFIGELEYWGLSALHLGLHFNLTSIQCIIQNIFLQFRGFRNIPFPIKNNGFPIIQSRVALTRYKGILFPPFEISDVQLCGETSWLFVFSWGRPGSCHQRTSQTWRLRQAGAPGAELTLTFADGQLRGNLLLNNPPQNLASVWRCGLV